MAVIKTDWQCWHGTYVSWNAGKGSWWHPNSDTACDDKSPMRVDRRRDQ